ncbi:MAG: SAM-dependent DNA methyltransferase [Opitutaceae bacterium]|nr:SAM-dependent DNA methyltransferase [Opitutaceae bacterium]
MSHQELANFIWQIADLLRGPYRPPQYERVMLPLTVLRRFDCVLAPTKAKVLAEHKRRQGGKLADEALDKLLNRAAGQRFHNHSPLDFAKLKGDPDHIDKHLTGYINGFSANVRRIFDHFEFTTEIEKLREANLLFKVVAKFGEVDLHPGRIDNIRMGLLFEDLIRRFNEAANETAGDHFTPREVIQLMVNLLFIHDDALLATPGTVRKLLDPACGTGGMLAEAQAYLREHHAEARLWVYGQDYNKRSYAVAASDLLIKDHENSRVEYGDSLLADQYPAEKFDYLLANPPFGVDWKKQQADIVREHEQLGFGGRFGAGLPRVNDGSLLFLQHMLGKFEPVLPEKHKHGSRLAIVFNGSPLFTGGAGSGESDIRKWIIERDWLEAIVALPEQMFYNTGIGTYLWIVSNRKEKKRRGRIQLIDARERWQPMRRSLGDKRRFMAETDIAATVREFGDARTTATSKIFANADFGYTRVTVERPLRLKFQITDEALAAFVGTHPALTDDMAALVRRLGRKPRLGWNEVWSDAAELLRERKSKWKPAEQKRFRDAFTTRDPAAEPVVAETWIADLAPDFDFAVARREGDFYDEKEAQFLRYEPDAELRDFENVPLTEDVDAYFDREVVPHVPDAWMDRAKDKVGYEINFNRHFYRYTPPRDLAAIDADVKKAEEEILRLLREVTK